MARDSGEAGPWNTKATAEKPAVIVALAARLEREISHQVVTSPAQDGVLFAVLPDIGALLLLVYFWKSRANAHSLFRPF